jgi:glucose-1-phosphate cytidylyltransferase
VNAPDIDVVILCGGKGTRLYPESVELPKALVKIGGTPIVEHVMRIYADQGFNRFVLAGGHLRELLVERYRSGSDDFDVRVVDTGDESGTGERIRRAREHVRGDTFMATYADGLGDVDIAGLVDAHIAGGRMATLTTVPLPSQYGTLILDDDDHVVEFREKPRLFDHWINGGFFVLERAALDVPGDSLEDSVLPELARQDQLRAYRHTGFWKSMDTFKDRQELEALAPGAPWRRGKRR